MNANKRLVLVLIFFSITNHTISQSNTIDDYTLRTVEGRKVYVENTALKNHKGRTQEAINLLAVKLKEIDKMSMTADAKTFLKSVTFFIDWKRRPRRAAEYHPSKQWLLSNGWLADKAKTVNIVNVNNFINWTKLNQPYMVLHELTHAYQDQKLRAYQAEIQKIYTEAMASGNYNSVFYFSGKKKFKKVAYAKNDNKEYLAELTEAFFGLNDYYPFNKKELQTHDPKAYKLLSKVWQGITPSDDDVIVCSNLDNTERQNYQNHFFSGDSFGQTIYIEGSCYTGTQFSEFLWYSQGNSPFKVDIAIYDGESISGKPKYIQKDVIFKPSNFGGVQKVKLQGGKGSLNFNKKKQYTFIITMKGGNQIAHLSSNSVKGKSYLKSGFNTDYDLRFEVKTK